MNMLEIRFSPSAQITDKKNERNLNISLPENAPSPKARNNNTK
jgi:hypothetical protein